MIFENEPIPLNIPEGVPLYRDERGTVRVSNSRVLLDIVVGALALGYNAEEISSQYTTASAAAVKGVLTYYQANNGEVDEYLRIRRERGDKIKEYFQSQPEYTEWLKRFKERARDKGLIR